MSSPAEILAVSAALLNDANGNIFTSVALTPYLNVALKELQEEFELNDVPVTHDTSVAVELAAGATELGFDTTPALPSDLIDIKQLWESPAGANQWLPMTKVDFLPHYLQDNEEISQFLVYQWNEQIIKVIAANADIDLKIDYIKSIFATITEDNIETELGIINADSFLQFRTAALAAQFIGENKTRADDLNVMAIMSKDRALGISTKGQQAITTRRRPFRQSYKQR